jgi:hypothetical protein
MGATWKQVNNAMVFYDEDFPHRWYEAIGEGVVKYLQDFLTLASDDTTGDATEWELTITEVAGATTHVITDVAGGALLITSGTNDNDGINMQLGAVAGENILLDGYHPLYFGVRVALGDATNSDFNIGVGVTDTETLGGWADAIYFRTVDTELTCDLVVENTNSETVIGTGTLADGVYVTLEFLFDGEDLSGYWNGQFMGSVNKASPDFPDDEEMRVTIEFETGEGNANTCTIAWIKMIHVRAT